MKKIYLKPYTSVKCPVVCTSMFATSNPTQPASPNYSLGGGSGTDNRSEDGFGVGEGDALTKKRFYDSYDESMW